MKILVTGSAGFIFSNMVKWFLQHTNHTIISVDKLTYAGSLLNISHNNEIPIKRHRFYLADVCDYDMISKIIKIEKPDIIIHAGAESHVDNSIANSHPFVNTNVVGTHSVLEAALKIHNPKLFINVSSDEVYGSVDQGFSIEGDPIEPRSPYSSTKAAADLLGQSYFTTYGLPVITTRCSNNFGPRQHPEKLIPKVIYNVLNKKPIPLYGDGKNVREWIYAKDHFNALLKIIEAGNPGEVYNISSGHHRTNREVLDTIFSIMGSGEELVEQVDDRLGHDRRYALNCDKLKSLGWQPSYTFEGAMKHTIGWYKSNSWFWKDK